MSELTHLEQKERFVEGQKRASSCCRELGNIQKNTMWFTIAAELDRLTGQGLTVLKNKSLTSSEIEDAITLYKKNYKVDGQ
jgi:hypothetical protein